jgi:hypothetical protein
VTRPAPDEFVHLDDDERGDPRFGYRGCTMQLHKTLFGYRCDEIDYAWRAPDGRLVRTYLRLDHLHPDVRILVSHPEWAAYGRRALPKLLRALAGAIAEKNAIDLADYERRQAFLARGRRAEAYRRGSLGG